MISQRQSFVILASGCVYPATSRAYEDVDETQDDEIDEEEFKEEQNSIACLIHMLYNDDLEEMLKVDLVKLCIPTTVFCLLTISWLFELL
ncbi:hypothetical protein ZIOFF_018281 [Zingiber officinale]|uniref:Uncharacterized protein n=1 Tax=Zingiber officinale TaxID=94328 RepID=A0A8J5HCS1_ZINOF|nr:hypothetical protein ZIOFF_018281 [Zingiber officinale]